jgi:hypothetical protein
MLSSSQRHVSFEGDMLILCARTESGSLSAVKRTSAALADLGALSNILMVELCLLLLLPCSFQIRSEVILVIGVDLASDSVECRKGETSDYQNERRSSESEMVVERYYNIYLLETTRRANTDIALDYSF